MEEEKRPRFRFKLIFEAEVDPRLDEVSRVLMSAMLVTNQFEKDPFNLRNVRVNFVEVERMN